MSLGHLAGEKGAPQFTFADIADARSRGVVWALTGCRKGAVNAGVDGTTVRRRRVGSWNGSSSAFGRDRVLVELWDHGDPIDSARNDALVEIAHRVGVECVATNNVHYATPAQRQLATAIAAVRAPPQPRRARPVAPGRLRRAPAGRRRAAPPFRPLPGVVELAGEIGRAAAFDLSLVAPNLPPFPCPDGLTEMQYLRQLAEEGGTRMYGQRAMCQTHRAPHGGCVVRSGARCV